MAVVVVGACLATVVACSSGPNVACPTTDEPLSRDEATATEAVEVASAAIGMADVPTETDQWYVQEEPRSLSFESGGGRWVLTRVHRSVLVDFVDIRPAVEALEAEGFEEVRSSDRGGTTYDLARGDQRASVSLGQRLRADAGKLWVTVRVDTGCRPA